MIQETIQWKSIRPKSTREELEEDITEIDKVIDDLHWHSRFISLADLAKSDALRRCLHRLNEELRIIQ